MKSLLFLIGLALVPFCFAQELVLNSERVHGPIEYYAQKVGQTCSLIIPPLFTTYKTLACHEAQCPTALGVGVAGVIWAGSFLVMRKFYESRPIQKEKAECSVQELLGLIADFPEVLDFLSKGKRDYSIYCPVDQARTRKLNFTAPELEHMFGGYPTYYGLDANGKPLGHIMVDEQPVRHPLITAWAKNRHYWKHW